MKMLCLLSVTITECKSVDLVFANTKKLQVEEVSKTISPLISRVKYFGNLVTDISLNQEFRVFAQYI